MKDNKLQRDIQWFYPGFYNLFLGRKSVDTNKKGYRIVYNKRSPSNKRPPNLFSNKTR